MSIKSATGEQAGWVFRLSLFCFVLKIYFVNPCWKKKGGVAKRRAIASSRWSSAALSWELV